MGMLFNRVHATLRHYVGRSFGPTVHNALLLLSCKQPCSYFPFLLQGSQNLNPFSFAEQMDKMMQVAQEAERTQAKLHEQKVQVAQEAARTQAKLHEQTARDEQTVRMTNLSPEEVAARHKEIKKTVQEISEMREKAAELQPEVKKMENKSKPPDIHITIPKDKIE